MLYSGIISHFKEVDVLCFSSRTNTLCKRITKGLSVKFKEVFQVVNTRLTQCLKWKTLGGKKRMLNQNELWNGHIYINLKKRKKKVHYSFLKNCTSNSATDISLREMNDSQDGENNQTLTTQPNTLSTSVFSTVEECYFLCLTRAFI